MGNKLAASPFPSYDSAASSYNAGELNELKAKFFKISGNQETITLANFIKASANSSSYVQKSICPRIFTTFDTRKDGVIDFEEYVCAITVFRLGSVEDKMKCIFLMYDGNKNGGSMTKDNFRQLMVEGALCLQKEDVPVSTLDMWLNDMKLLSQAVAETAFIQFACHINKMEIQEFIAFAKTENTVLGIIPIIVSVVDS